METTSLTCDHSITITKIGENTRIEYNGQTFIPYHYSNRQIKEAVATARADERERIAQAIEARRDSWNERVDHYAYTDAARIARGDNDE